MEIEIRLDPAYTEPKLVIHTAALTPELEALIQRVEDFSPGPIVGFGHRGAELLRPDDILRIYGEQQKVVAQTEKDRFILRIRLYEAEARLTPYGFVRISGSELINLRRAKRLDMGFTGTVLIELEGGVSTYVSRRYMSAIKRRLGI